MATDLDRRAVRRGFERAAGDYDAHAVLQQQVCERLLSRLDYIKCTPATVLDVGAGTGQAARTLQRRYPECRVIALDLAADMLRGGSRRGRWWRRSPRAVQGDAEALPLRDATVDLLVSASTFQWCSDHARLFAEIRRVLRPGGTLLFATFGPDTLRELRTAWQQVDDEVHVHELADMHVLGDAMLRAGLHDPVVDTEWLTVTYADPHAVMADLRAVGATNASAARRTGLRGRGSLRRLLDAYPRDSDGRCPATYEVIYGHAWGAPGASRTLNVPFQDLR